MRSSNVRLADGLYMVLYWVKRHLFVFSQLWISRFDKFHRGGGILKAKELILNFKNMPKSPEFDFSKLEDQQKFEELPDDKKQAI